MTTSTLTNTEKHEHIALIISCCSGIILLLWCSWFAYNTNSLIINLDANAYIIASIVDLITLGVSLIQKKKKTKTHPMGYGGYIPLINLLRSCLLISICIQAFLEAVNSFAHPMRHDSHELLFTYISVVIGVSIIAFIIVNYLAKKSHSKLLYTDALEWKIDICFAFVILLVFIAGHFLHHSKYAKIGSYLDPVMCLILSLVLVKTPLKLLWKNVKTLIITSIDKNDEESIVTSIRESIPTKYLNNLEFKALDVANHLWLDIYVSDHSIIIEDIITIEKEAERVLKEYSQNYKVTFYFVAS